MDGAMVRSKLVPFVGGPAADAALAKAGWSFGDLDSSRCTRRIARSTHHHRTVADRRVSTGVCSMPTDEFGNTTSATIPLALALNPEQLQVGSRFGCSRSVAGCPRASRSAPFALVADVRPDGQG
jgi:hypothetical protein